LSYYLKYIVPERLLYEKLNQEQQYKKVIFYLDILGISRGFYNKKTVDWELGRYMQTQQMPTTYPEELKAFLNNLYTKFKRYSPKFVMFYDGGECLQNTTISKFYKAERASQKYFYLEEAEKEAYSAIKNYYLNEVDKQFNKQDLSCVMWSQEYEMDLIPHYVISNNYIDSQNPDTLNVMLAVDKDLLQTCKFENVVQAVSTYRKATGVELKLYDRNSAVGYIHSGFKRGGLNADYVPLILALASDKIDGIQGIPRVGPATAVKLIQTHNLPPIITTSTKLPQVLEQYRDLIINNLKLTDFDQQIYRIPNTEINQLNKRLEILQ
jgi:hypothetical protein